MVLFLSLEDHEGQWTPVLFSYILSIRTHDRTTFGLGFNIMKTTCILVCSDQALLSDVIESLLSPKEEMEVVVITNDSEDELMEAVRRRHPDVVILCQSSHNARPNRLMRLLMQTSGMQVVTVSASDNMMRVYGKQEVQIHKTSDLLTALSI
jgi:chemotaxis response regulator CheB